MNDALHCYLKPHTIERLQKQAQTSRPLKTYLVLLYLSAFLIKLAQGEEEHAPECIDQAVTATAQNLFPGDVQALLTHLTGDTALDYCQRRERVTRAGKTALFLRLRATQER